MEEKIELTQQELVDLKDEIKFRECVVLQLKQLSGAPKKITVLETKVAIYGAFVIAIVIGMARLTFMVLAK